jgi:hypothetical protein
MRMNNVVHVKKNSKNNYDKLSDPGVFNVDTSPCRAQKKTAYASEIFLKKSMDVTHEY